MLGVCMSINWYRHVCIHVSVLVRVYIWPQMHVQFFQDFYLSHSEDITLKYQFVLSESLQYK